MTAIATDLFADGWLSSPPQYRTDLDLCEPASALSPTGKRGRWRTMSFETDDVTGTMIAAGPETAAPAVSFPLRASGWHAVSVGIVPNFKCTDDTATIAVPVKLSGEDTCSLLTLDLSSLQTRLLPDWARAGRGGDVLEDCGPHGHEPRYLPVGPAGGAGRRARVVQRPGGAGGLRQAGATDRRRA